MLVCAFKYKVKSPCTTMHNFNLHNFEGGALWLRLPKKVAKPSLQSIFTSSRDLISIITSGTQNPMKIFIHMCV